MTLEIQKARNSSLRSWLRVVVVAASLSSAAALYADTLGQGGPMPDQHIIEAAKRERSLVIYSNIHEESLRKDLLANFKALYPFLTIDNYDVDGARIYKRFRKEVSAKLPSADIILSSAMDFQEKLINDGYAQPYSPTELNSIPNWAHWNDLGFDISSEPVVFVFNRRYVHLSSMPRTHLEFQKFVERNRDLLKGRIAVYDPRQSQVAMMLLSQDIAISRDSWNLFDEFAKVDSKLYGTSQGMLDALVSGKQWVAYDAISSYANEMKKSHPELTIVYPSDYVLTISRVSFVVADARHPNAAKLFLDFLLSRTGQSILARHGMQPVRRDIGTIDTENPRNLNRVHAIRIGPGLLADLDALVRGEFLRRWDAMWRANRISTN